MKNKHKIVVSVSGASGAIYAKVLFEKLQNLTILRKTINQETHFGVLGRISYYLHLKNENLH